MRNDFLDKKYGLFVHYVWVGQEYYQTGVEEMGVGAIYPDGAKVQDINEMIEKFDAEQFAKDCAEAKFQYVVFTSHHFGMHPLYPSEVFRKWRYHKDDNPRREDLIEKIYQELKRYGIDLFLYIHPHDIHDFCEEDKAAFHYVGKNREECNANMDTEKWQDYIDEFYRELMERYKGKIKGIYLDESFGDPDVSEQMNDYERIRRTIKSCDPEIIMIQNYYGSTYTLDTGMLENALVWHGAVHGDVNTWATTYLSSGSVIRNYAGSWWARHSVGEENTTEIAAAEDLYRYTVLQAGQNTDGGGVAWAAGPYCGSWKDEKGQNNIWEPGIRDTLMKLGRYIAPVKEAVFQTRPSMSFPTAGGTRFGQLKWGVATQSRNGKKTYIHVMKPDSESKTVCLGIPADRKVFREAKLLKSGKKVELIQNEKGVAITLPEDETWDEINTVIELQS